MFVKHLTNIPPAPNYQGHQEREMFEKLSQPKSSHFGTVGYESNISGLGHYRSTGLIPSPAQWVKGSSVVTAVILVAAAAQIQSLAQGLLHARGAAIKRKNNKQAKKLSHPKGL